MRFAVCAHDHPHAHLDVFLGDPDGDRDERALAAWRAPGETLQAFLWHGVAERLEPHRRIYLEHEGEISGGRGHIVRLAWGDATPVEGAVGEGTQVVVDLDGVTREGASLIGRLTLHRGQGGRWRSHFRPPGGAFVAFEGVDGSGKSTAMALVAALLEGRGATVWRTAEPTRVGFGAVIRARLSPGAWQDPLAMALGFAADRAEHLYTPDGILARRARGEIVLSDRYKLSSIVYQTQAGLADELVLALNRGYPEPDLTLLFDVDVEVALARLRRAEGRGGDLYEHARFLEGVRARYLQAASAATGVLVMIDGSAPQETVAAHAIDAIAALVG